ncbi:short chain dehydrogenase [Paracoccus halophilus]|uniref:Short chain dehydrogenase n=1 Tax=Paracoccus halophilus TaxID=376733 RepID=A0A1I0T7B6_9RHOB|nr:SDR family NAD(P)-dependent oxidoreductase [Paracoccus halophilus]SFA47652.1 short chain dehydrogenase [Paracoccus halophilus]
MGKLTGKTAYVTGSGRGIGRAVALKLAAEGAAIVLNDLDEAPAAEVAADIAALGGKSIPVIGSVTEAGFAERFIQAGLDAFGGIDIIVNNAGYTWDSMAAKMTDDQFDAMYDVHVKAPFRILRAAAPISARSRDDWAALFTGTDACVAPVLSPVEAAAHPLSHARGILVEAHRALQAAPAPRFAGAPRSTPPPPTARQHRAEIIALLAQRETRP